MRASRRQILTLLLAGPIGLAPLPARAAGTAAAELAPTPACTDAAERTRAQSEGPYFTPQSPLKRDFAADSPGGTRITAAGFVLDTVCRPQPGALVELWHADADGRYDNDGFRLRGHQFTDAEGRWAFDTIVPGRYVRRTPHFHAKVQRRGGPILTTQIYFPGEPANARDRMFDERLLLAVSDVRGGRIGRFDFVMGARG